MKKRGFTLIELLAVIVVLAVVALIAFPIIAGIIEKTKRSAAYRSVEGYVEAANNAAILYDLDNNKGINVTEAKHTFTSNVDTDAFSKIKAKGTLPTYSYLEFDINKKVVTEGHFCINGYSVLYSEGKAQSSETNYCEGDNAGEVIIIPKDEGNSCVNAQAYYNKTIFSYEALGEEDDYIYICRGGEWEPFRKANLRWDGYIFNNGAFDNNYFVNSFSTYFRAEQGYGPGIEKYMTAQISDNKFVVKSYVNAGSDTPQREGTFGGSSTINKQWEITEPCKIEITYDLTGNPFTTTVYFMLRTNNTDISNTLFAGGSPTDAVVIDRHGQTWGNNLKTVLTVPNSLVGEKVYLSVGMYYKQNAKVEHAMSIKSIRMIFD